MQRRKTVRQQSKVGLPLGNNINSKKMVKRNSCNDHQIIGLPSISPMYMHHQIPNENKYSSSSVSTCSSTGKNKLPSVKRYNSGSTKDIIKEENIPMTSISTHSSVLSTQNSNVSSVSSGSSGSKIRGSSSTALKNQCLNRKKP